MGHVSILGEGIATTGGVAMVDCGRLERLQKAALIVQQMKFVSAVSGLKYDNPGAAGDVSEIIFNGKRYVLKEYGPLDVARDILRSHNGTDGL